MNKPLTALLPIIDAAEKAVAEGSLPVDVLNITQPVRHAIHAARQSPSVDALDVEQEREAVWRAINGSLREAGYADLLAMPDDDLLVRLTDRLRNVFRLSPAPAGEDEPTSAEIECDRECNSDCHPDDCEHHGHLPRRASEAASGNMGSEKDGRWAHGIERKTVMHGVDAPYAITEFLAYLPTGHVKSFRCPCRPRKSARGPWVHSPEALA
jgi:hypothetical protein